MKVNESVEQAVFALLILAAQKNNAPVKSSAISDTLKISDSYLKKTLRKLVVAKLIKSSASKDGGFQLARAIEEITLYDVYRAIETEKYNPQLSARARNVFGDQAHVKQGEAIIVKTFLSARSAFDEQLKSLYLATLLTPDGCIDESIDGDK